MRTMALLMLSLMANTTLAQEPARLRAQAALALALAEPARPQATYQVRYQLAIRESKPLLVWVGQPARPVRGCIHHETDTFPGTDTVAVIVGVPTGTGMLHRVDLPGCPQDADIRAALATHWGKPAPRTPVPVRP
ncbi:MAG: hypothetical protein LC104_04500 [Bacteroidales bacterium]|nr:hypothetical protein [Bacteroidales bacterium]